VTNALLERAREGDEQAFAALTGPMRRELHVHCYRILGSLQDAEDVLQETLLAAWRGLDSFEQRASMRTWLYRIATNRCLNSLRAAGRRAPVEPPFSDLPVPEPSRETEVTWLEPYPDLLLESVADSRPGPDTRYEAAEAISLAFITVLQTLPPRQRAVLILRDVLGFRAAEVAEMLEVTEESVTSALKRARATMSEAADRHAPPPPPDSPQERELVRRLSVAYETGDLEGLLALLTDDVWLRMPPIPLEYQGLERAERFFAVVMFPRKRLFRTVPTRANGQPAIGLYVEDPTTGLFRSTGVIVITLAGEKISVLTKFENSVLPAFGLPRTLPER
jgi:RNA polymerase sigma-70 factor (TIGR02960 family)